MAADPLGAMRGALALCRRHFVAAAGFSALVNLLYIVPTLYMLQVYDRVVPTRGIQTLLFLTVVLLFALATLALLDRIRARLLVRAGVQIDAALAPLVLDATLGRPDLPVARAALREFDAMRQTLTGPGILALFDAPWVPIYVLVCFLVHPWIGLVALLGCIALPLIALANERATRTRLDRAQVVAGASYAAQETLLGSADTVRALGMRRALVARQLRQREAMLVAQTEANFAAGGFLTLTKFVRLALQSLALGLGALLAVDNLISAGAIFASSFLIARALAPIEQLIGTWRPIIQSRQSYRSLETLLDTAPPLAASTHLPPPRGAVSLEGVTVLNDARDGALLQAITLSVAPGEVVAIVGPSGAGKSTLVRAIAGALLPDRGTVRFDGADARDWDPERLARHIGYLPQDSALFAGSIAENIARFDGEIGAPREGVDAAIVAAATSVGADPLIRRMTNGYDHQLRLGGRGISAGQAQRIALARAVYGNPQILILDEPNAHLDAEGDAALVAALGALKAKGRTILIVSHKLGILPVVDRILVLRDGRVEMFGPREEVLPRIAPANVRRVVPPPPAARAS
ncbi:Alkaline protease secretion ATP-binding protein AprD [Sphingomonas sp. EC-HK361]|uniref:type I secretion system permease/ATPase n=1 Tax=Sphingomonas sp. EC-HK361 TaxID=2038397 RepID=UPI001251DA0C|nr:type I secretion system permease/ATPase [Sphingomonas sp. EC-HK361]VVT02274.1 Alkaline protease secretion ATP-binding protein AprD [Sphingomonas sp. EC-HK361]